MAEQMNHFENNRCHTPFTQCIHSTRIKLILERYNNIISDKTDKSDQQLQNEVNDMINNIIPADVSYSNVQLINDFYHIKYDHNINDDLNQLCSFHKYLFDNEDVLKCDISYCESAKRYYDGRNRSYNSSKDNTNLLHLICRIHTYLIHAYETDRLTADEIRYIESKLNEFKDDDENVFNDRKLQTISKVINDKKRKLSFITRASDNSKYITSGPEQSLNFTEISTILNQNGILIKESHLINACEEHGYHQQQLIDDLCDIMLTGEDNSILLVQIFLNDLNFTDKSVRKQVYDIILFQYIKKQELNNDNFIKILRKTVSELFQSIDCDEVENITRNANLTGNIFSKQSSEFINSSKFAKIFKSMKNWKKKQWGNIYTKINKWKMFGSNVQSKKKILSIPESKTEYLEETKLMEHETDYIDHGTDEHLIHQFCSMTNTTKEIATSFLDTTEWNVLFAVDKYYATNGKLSHYQTFQSKSEKPKYMIYTHGISFWYWKNENLNKRLVVKQFQNLKEEML
eukprot:447149_1